MAGMYAGPSNRVMVAAANKGIRWDRVSRYGLLVVFAGLLFLYVNPARSYLNTVRESHHRQAQLHALQREHDTLLRREHALADPHVVEAEARRLGMVLPGERPYIVRGLPRGK
jgi:cell division protein FtsB